MFIERGKLFVNSFPLCCKFAELVGIRAVVGKGDFRVEGFALGFQPGNLVFALFEIVGDLAAARLFLLAAFPVFRARGVRDCRRGPGGCRGRRRTCRAA